MMNTEFKRRRAASRNSELDCLFASRAHRDSFPSFYNDLARRSGLGGIDDMASAYRLYLFLGELEKRR